MRKVHSVVKIFDYIFFIIVTCFVIAFIDKVNGVELISDNFRDKLFIYLCIFVIGPILFRFLLKIPYVNIAVNCIVGCCISATLVALAIVIIEPISMLVPILEIPLMFLIYLVISLGILLGIMIHMNMMIEQADIPCYLISERKRVKIKKDYFMGLYNELLEAEDE